MALADDFRASLLQLPDDWGDARFTLKFRDAARAARAAAALGGINPGRHGETVRFHTTRRGAGQGPDAVARALKRIDRQRLGGELALVSSDRVEPVPETKRATLTAAWDAAVAGLPPDWSDVYGELELTSSDQLERAALLMAPTNPARYGDRPGFRFRCARRFGYGAAPEMVRRGLQRMDEEGVRGEVRILHALSDTQPWSTQGPVWYVGGKSV